MFTSESGRRIYYILYIFIIIKEKSNKVTYSKIDRFLKRFFTLQNVCNLRETHTIFVTKNITQSPIQDLV